MPPGKRSGPRAIALAGGSLDRINNAKAAEAHSQEGLCHPVPRARRQKRLYHAAPRVPEARLSGATYSVEKSRGKHHEFSYTLAARGRKCHEFIRIR